LQVALNKISDVVLVKFNGLHINLLLDIGGLHIMVIVQNQRHGIYTVSIALSKEYYLVEPYIFEDRFQLFSSLLNKRISFQTDLDFY
jgi:hypothetical protein